MIELSDKIKEKALSLPSEERLMLIDELIKSLNLPTNPDIDQKWKAEAEKRVKELDEGIVKSIDGEQVFDEISAKLIYGAKYA